MTSEARLPGQSLVGVLLSRLREHVSCHEAPAMECVFSLEDEDEVFAALPALFDVAKAAQKLTQFLRHVDGGDGLLTANPEFNIQRVEEALSRLSPSTVNHG